MTHDILNPGSGGCLVRSGEEITKTQVQFESIEKIKSDFVYTKYVLPSEPFQTHSEFSPIANKSFAFG